MTALEIAERALALANADDVEVTVTTERSVYARFANSEVHQPTLVNDAVVGLRVVREGRQGVASTNRTSDGGLAELARRTIAEVESATPDESLPGLAEPADYPAVAGYDAVTAALGAEEQSRLAGTAIDTGNGLGIYGYLTSGVCELAVATTTGVRAHQMFTDATVLTLAADDGASGWSEATSWRMGDLDPAAVAHKAIEKAERTRGAVGLEPGRYRAVLEPYAIAELLLYLGFDSFGALGLLEERSVFSGRIGERLFDPKVSIADDALDPRGLPKAFDFEGTPRERVQLVEDGVVRGVVWDRVTAARAGDGARSTGHALPAAARAYGPLALAVSMAPGEAGSTEELAELVGDGIYVTRVHYPGVVSPRDGVITGMTCDGTFRIRNGKVAEPLVNLRFTVSMPDLLGDVPGLTRDVELVNQSDYYDERYPYAYLVPALATASFNVTGTGSEPGL
jgi:predicted Zn-dependent protease